MDKMSLQLDTLSWFWTSSLCSYFLILHVLRRSSKYQFYKFLVWPDCVTNHWSTTLDLSTLNITPLMRYKVLYTKLFFFQLRWTPFRRSAYIRQLAAPPVKKTRGQAYEIDKKFFGALIKPKVNTKYDSSFRNFYYQKNSIFTYTVFYGL